MTLLSGSSEYLDSRLCIDRGTQSALGPRKICNAIRVLADFTPFSGLTDGNYPNSGLHEAGMSQ